MLRPLSIALLALLATGCTHLATRAQPASPDHAPAHSQPNAADAWASRYEAIASPPLLITGATVLVGNGQRLDNADVLVEDGKITHNCRLPPGPCAWMGAANG